MNKILVLYTEYAPYLHACLKKISDIYCYEIHVIRYPIDKNAPFQFPDEPNIKFYDRKELNKKSILGLYKKIDPQCIFTSGWFDREYNSLLPKFKQDGKMVIGVVDNQWTGSLKQQIFALVGRFFIRRSFTNIWIPGFSQYEYMRKAGVPTKAIMTGYYCADTDLYNADIEPTGRFKKRFIYVGRLLDIKGTPTLLAAIEKVNMENVDWEFLIIGKGKYEPEVIALSQKYSNVIYKPFLQPEELLKETQGGGVFVLPSNYDAWGVVVHEFSLLGYPLVLSSMVGSRHYFVTPGYNGYIFESQNAESLAKTLKKVMKLDEAYLKQMSERSKLIGNTMNTEAWAARLNEAIESHYN